MRVGCYTGASESAVTNVDSEGGGTGVKFNKEDTVAGTTAPIPIPPTTGTAFSWHKNLALNVTVGDSTTISNRRIRHESALPTGMELSFLGTDTFAQSAAADSDSGSDGATPSGYTDMTTSNQVFDADGVSAASTGRNGDFARVALAVSSNYGGGASSAAAVGDLKVVYDEA